MAGFAWVMRLLALALLSAGLLSPALAQPVRMGGNIFAADQVVDIRASDVVRQIFAAGENVWVDATTTQDVHAAGRYVTIRNGAGQDVYATGWNVSVDGPVGADVYAAGRYVDVRGTVAGSLFLAAEIVEIQGRIDGDVFVAAETLVMGPEASIGGKLRYKLGQPLRIPDGAVRSGDVVGDVETEAQPNKKTRVAVDIWASLHLSFAVIGLLVVALAPVPAMRSAVQVASSPWSALLWGFLKLAAALVMIILLAVTVVGIPMALILLLALPHILMLSYLSGAMGWACLAARLTRQTPYLRWYSRVGALLVALVILWALGHVPYINVTLISATTLLGLGGMVLSCRKAVRAEAA